MQYVRWKGVDIAGSVHKGSRYIQSKKQLEALLLKRGIAMTDCMPSYCLLRRSVTLSHKISLFRQLVLLLKSGLLLPDALSHIANQTSHSKLQVLLYDLEKEIRNGASMATGMRRYGGIFDPFIIASIAIGQESGALEDACIFIADFLEMKHQWYAQLRSALAMPAVTFAFLGISIVLILGFIIPQFADVFASMGGQSSATHQSLLAVSESVRGGNILIVMSLAFLLMYAIVRCKKSQRGRRLWSIVAAHIPVIRVIVLKHQAIQLIESIMLLLRSGVPLERALSIIKKNTDNIAIQDDIGVMHDTVASGMLLSVAMQKVPNLFDDESIALIAVGEEAGMLIPMLQTISRTYNDQLKRYLDRISVCIQPLAILVLGILVAALMYAVYIPIINFSTIA